MSDSTTSALLEQPLTPEIYEALPPETLSFGAAGHRISVTQLGSPLPSPAMQLAVFVGKNLASKIGSAIGGKVFGEVMKALGMGGPDLEGMLADITKRLDVIEQTVNEIKVIVTALLRELQELRASMDQSFGEAKLADAFTTIDAAYGSHTLRASSEPHQVGLTTPTLMELLYSLPKTQTPQKMKEYTAEFARAENDVWKITTQIVSIHNALTTEVGQTRTLISRWTNGLLLAVENKQLDLSSAYATLEGYFLQAISKQLTAVSMHCFALGSGDNPDLTRIDTYLLNDFGTMMRKQTDEFLHNVERLVLSRTKLLKVPSVFTPEQSSEFPAEMESVFLRADLLCAALNLVSNTRTVDSPKQAVAGIYGRSIARHGDISGTSGPTITPNGYAESRGKVARPIANLHAIDLRRDGNLLVLGDCNDSAPTIVRYFWPWPATLPPQGTPIDTRFRGGIRPAYFNVFLDNDWPLAAGFVDFSPVLTGAPAGSPFTLGENTLFPTDNPHTVIHQQTFVPGSSHLLVGPQKGQNRIAWQFDHAVKAHGGWNRTTNVKLFKYSGKAAKIRLHAHVICEVESVSRQKYLSSIREIELVARAAAISDNGVRIEKYDSANAGNGELRMSHKGQGYKASVESWPVFEFEIKPGEYSLNLHFITWLGTHHTQYTGWEADALRFNLDGLFVEWV